MSQAKDGDTVKVHFTGRLENGDVFDTSKNSQPLEFTIGSADVAIGLQKGLVGMEVGDTKTITVGPEEGYGPRRKELIVDVDKSKFPKHITPAIGKRVQAKQQDGNLIDLIITDINEDTVTLDANHALAGKILFFEVELVKIT